jgi:hypothetical protein
MPTADRDYTHLAHQYQRYAQRKGLPGVPVEDVAQEMLCYALAHPGIVLSTALVYHRALDALLPRHQVHGVRQRYTPYPEAPTPPVAAPDPPSLPGVPSTGRVRAVRLLHAVYGCTLAEIAWLFGVSTPRICQVLHAPATEESVDAPALCVLCAAALG